MPTLICLTSFNILKTTSFVLLNRSPLLAFPFLFYFSMWCTYRCVFVFGVTFTYWIKLCIHVQVFTYELSWNIVNGRKINRVITKYSSLIYRIEKNLKDDPIRCLCHQLFWSSNPLANLRVLMLQKVVHSYDLINNQFFFFGNEVTSTF